MKEAVEARQRQANRTVHGEYVTYHYYSLANPARGEKPAERGAGPVKPTGGRLGASRN